MAEKPSLLVRAVTLPVAEVVDQSWDWLNPHLTAAWKLSTDLANWSVHRLFTLDTPGARESEAVRNWYGYGDAGANYPGWSGWSGAMNSAGCVLRAVHRKYRQVRFDVMVRHAHNLLTYRYPYPFPVHNQAWQAGYAAGDFPTVSLPLPGCGRVTLRLKRRADFGRQLAMFRELHDGSAVRGEAALYRDRKGVLLLKLVGKFPRRSPGERTRVCLLTTQPDAFLVAEIDGRPATVTNGDHMRRVLAALRSTSERHAVCLERTRQDKKREVRMDRWQRANLCKAVAERCGKQRDRVDTHLHQVAAQVARYCDRQGVASVVYDDSVRTFFGDSFPWHVFGVRLADKLGALGIEFVARGKAVDERQGVARGSECGGPDEACAAAKRGRNGHLGHRARGRSRDAVKTGPGDGLQATAPEPLR